EHPIAVHVIPPLKATSARCGTAIWKLHTVRFLHTICMLYVDRLSSVKWYVGVCRKPDANEPAARNTPRPHGGRCWRPAGTLLRARAIRRPESRRSRAPRG